MCVVQVCLRLFVCVPVACSNVFREFRPYPVGSGCAAAPIYNLLLFHKNIIEFNYFSYTSH
jgi:hypothetical protein